MKIQKIILVLLLTTISVASCLAFLPKESKKPAPKSTNQDTLKAVKTADLSKQSDSITFFATKFKLYKNGIHASYYHDKFHGRRTASGKPYNKNKYTAAHKTLPFGTKVRVTNDNNGKSVIVEITDRGPFVKGREIDLSRRAFMEITRNASNGAVTATLELVK